MEYPASFEEYRLKKVLSDIYPITMEHFFPDDIVPHVMEKLTLSEEEMIHLLKIFIEKGWISTKGIIPKFFLRPGFVCGFPLVISARGLSALES